MYYTHGSHLSHKDWSSEQAIDFEVCHDLLLLAKDFLGFEYEDFPKIRGYVGFSSGGFCQSPAEYEDSWHKPNDKFKENCEEDQSGYFNPKCRPWYRKILEHPNETIMLDLYPDASTNLLVTSICQSVRNQADSEQFYATICMDISIIQFFFDTLQQVTDLGPSIYYEPKILQLNNELSMDHLS